MLNQVKLSSVCHRLRFIAKVPPASTEGNSYLLLCIRENVQAVCTYVYVYVLNHRHTNARPTTRHHTDWRWVSVRHSALDHSSVSPTRDA